jgi:hypothetical protein
MNTLKKLPSKVGYLSLIWAGSRTAEPNGQNSNEMLIFQKGIMKDDLGISKVMKIALSNLNDMVFRS